MKLLNGTFDYTTTGVTATELDEVQVNAALIPDAGSIGVTVAASYEHLVPFGYTLEAFQNVPVLSCFDGFKPFQEYHGRRQTPS